MILKTRPKFERPKDLNVASVANTTNTILGTAVTVKLLRDQPIEELQLRVKCQVSANGALTLNTAVNPESIMGIVKKIKINRPAGSQAPAGTVVVDYRGIGILEFAANEGLNLPDDTLGAIIASQGATIAASQLFTITYRIALVHPQIAEPLRERCVFPVHTFTEQPTMEVTFENSANIYTGGTVGVIEKIACELVYIRRQQNPTHTANILATGGYIPMDLVETPYAIPALSGAEQNLKLPLSAKVLNYQFCLYQGGANITRNVPDAVTTIGQESTILLKVGGDTLDMWTWEQLKVLNCFSRVRNSHLAASAPALGLPVAAGTSFSVPASVMRDFLSDGVGSGGDPAYEFGSVLDADAIKALGSEIELNFTPSNVATNGHTIYVGSRRLWGDLTNYSVLLKMGAQN